MRFSNLIKAVCFTCLFFAGISAYSQSTIVWIVRHAEKDLTDPKNPDPELSADGRQRAKDLAAFLDKSDIAAFYATPYKRTNQTAAPFAMATGKMIQPYAPASAAQLVKEVSEKFAGKAVVVVGHSNTVLELVDAFGGKRPLATLTDDDYDYLFKVSLGKNKPAITETFQFGKRHRAEATIK